MSKKILAWLAILAVLLVGCQQGGEESPGVSMCILPP